MKSLAWRVLLVALTGLPVLAWAAGPALAWSAGPAHLRQVSIKAGSGKTRIRLNLSHAVHFHTFELAHPPRLVVDMDNTRGRRPSIHRTHGNGVKSVRLGRHKNGMLRAVFVLQDKTPAHIHPASHYGAHIRATLALGDKVASRHSHSRKTRRQSAARFQAAQKKGPVVVVIDPGHGGSDPGTTGPHGLHEKTVTLAIGEGVARKLNHTPGVRAYMTRRTDHYVSLVHRVVFAQHHHANVFVSIHENAFNKDPAVKGGTCFALSTHGASDAEAQQQARLENSHDRQLDGVNFSKYGPKLNAVLTDIFQSAAIHAEIHLGRDIIHQFGKVEPIYDRKVQRANFAVLRDPLIPSVLCETAFLSNPRQARELHYHHFRAEIANAIYKGIMAYLHRYAPRQLEQHSPGAYIVRRGDTLSAIASKFDVATRRIKNANGLQTTTLQVGERLTIPDQKANS